MKFCISALDKLFEYVAIAILAFNLCVASIPRCNFVFALLQHSLLSDGDAGNQPSVCHEARQSSKHESRISNEDLCRCSLLQYMAFVPSNFDPREYIYFRESQSRLIVFASQNELVNFILGPEPPYPKITTI